MGPESDDYADNDLPWWWDQWLAQPDVQFLLVAFGLPAAVTIAVGLWWELAR